MQIIKTIALLMLGVGLGGAAFKVYHDRGAPLAGPVSPMVASRVFIPEREVQGTESSSFNLYVHSPGGETTGLGQIFQPPATHPLLQSVSFLCRETIYPERVTDLRVQLRIARWEVDHPVDSVLWESEPLFVSRNFRVKEIRFQVPQLRLEPGAQYIAWLVLPETENPEFASLGVFAMGPRTRAVPQQHGQSQPESWDIAYPLGTRALWQHEIQGRTMDYLARYRWKTDQPGQNLHFRMEFGSH
ncbi:hypothetical protein [Chitinilyticum piscinae]|uniref:Uncharacterized protein n=1 Tax=Chitinilyticum piscinae TaxID=2866724 RepID=A0A8J7K7J3_9NEIS|nr:hypothetical protein [Chitinilyticum piscinae]MBE9608158.1 hypothetical protein [Chitinilyticum piscinae]